VGALHHLPVPATLNFLSVRALGPGAGDGPKMLAHPANRVPEMATIERTPHHGVYLIRHTAISRSENSNALAGRQCFLALHLALLL
jgi:hypothetical protein